MDDLKFSQFLTCNLKNMRYTIVNKVRKQIDLIGHHIFENSPVSAGQASRVFLFLNPLLTSITRKSISARHFPLNNDTSFFVFSNSSFFISTIRKNDKLE